MRSSIRGSIRTPRRRSRSAIFTTESPERRERYDLISAYLQGRKLNCLVDFEYRDRSIRSAGDGKWYPLIIMEWVQGETLFQWLRARCMEGNREAIAAVADRWLEAVQELSDNSVAHGDLQHANVMVNSDLATETGRLRRHVRSAPGWPAEPRGRRRALPAPPSRGRHAAFARPGQFLRPGDLRRPAGTGHSAGLWVKYVEQVGYDKLLFRREDFQAPAQSPLYYDLVQLGNNDLRNLTERLFRPVRKRGWKTSRRWASWPTATPRSSACWPAGSGRRPSSLLNRRGHFRDAPARLQPLIYQAYEHVCRQQAWTRVPANDAESGGETSEQADRQLAEAWNESLFANFPPAEQQRQRIVDARQRVQLLDRLRHLIQHSAGKVSLSGEKGLAVTAANLPEGYQHGLQDRVEPGPATREGLRPPGKGAEGRAPARRPSWRPGRRWSTPSASSS